jgi:hypothetical protein
MRLTPGSVSDTQSVQINFFKKKKKEERFILAQGCIPWLLVSIASRLVVGRTSWQRI